MWEKKYWFYRKFTLNSKFTLSLICYIYSRKYTQFNGKDIEKR